MLIPVITMTLFATSQSVKTLDSLCDQLRRETKIIYRLPESAKHLRCSARDVPLSDLPMAIATALRGTWKPDSSGVMNLVVDFSEEKLLRQQFNNGVESLPLEIRPLLRKLNVERFANVRKTWLRELPTPNLTDEERAGVSLWMNREADAPLGSLWITGYLSKTALELTLMSVTTEAKTVEFSLSVPLITKRKPKSGIKLPEFAQPWRTWLAERPSLDTNPWVMESNKEPLDAIYNQLHNKMSECEGPIFTIWNPTLATLDDGPANQHPLIEALMTRCALTAYDIVDLGRLKVFRPESLVHPQNIPRLSSADAVVRARGNPDRVADLVRTLFVGIPIDDYEFALLAGAHKISPLPVMTYRTWGVVAWSHIAPLTRAALRNGQAVSLSALPPDTIWSIANAARSVTCGRRLSGSDDVVRLITLDRARCWISAREDVEPRYSAYETAACPILTTESALSAVGLQIRQASGWMQVGTEELLKRARLIRSEWPVTRVTLHCGQDAVASFVVRQQPFTKSADISATDLPANELELLREYMNRLRPLDTR